MDSADIVDSLIRFDIRFESLSLMGTIRGLFGEFEEEYFGNGKYSLIFNDGSSICIHNVSESQNLPYDDRAWKILGE